jgi:hypothetical protein
MNIPRAEAAVVYNIATTAAVKETAPRNVSEANLTDS